MDINAWTAAGRRTINSSVACRLTGILPSQQYVQRLSCRHLFGFTASLGMVSTPDEQKLLTMTKSCQ
eukprot:6192447-Pleurochrysis_carterae.AAC.4